MVFRFWILKKDELSLWILFRMIKSKLPDLNKEIKNILKQSEKYGQITHKDKMKISRLIRKQGSLDPKLRK